jgi:hypothetical protein
LFSEIFGKYKLKFKHLKTSENKSIKIPNPLSRTPQTITKMRKKFQARKMQLQTREKVKEMQTTILIN